MANRWKGNFIVATEATSSGTAYTGKANGAWSLNNQIQQKQANLWAKGVGAPTAPTIGTATAGNANASVTFTASSDAGASGSLTYTATSTPGSFTNTGSSSPIVVSGLTNGTQYTFKVKATNSLGYVSPDSAASASTGTAVPGAPTIGTAVAGSGNASIAFTPPANTGGLTITGYTATSSPGSITGTAASSPVTVSGLTNGTFYTFTVVATNAVGNSSPSATSNSVLVGKPAIVMGLGISPYVEGYELNTTDNTFGTKLSNPGILPSSAITSIAFSPDAKSVALAGVFNSPLVYAWAGGLGTKYSDPSTGAGTIIKDMVFSHDSSKILMATTSPFIAAYNWSSTNGYGTKLSGPAAGLTGSLRICRNSDTTLVLTGHYASPYSTAVSVGTSLGNLTRGNASFGGAVNQAVFSKNSDAVIAARDLTPGLAASHGVGGTMYAAPSVPPNSTCETLAQSYDGSSIFVNGGTNPYLYAYPWSSAGFGTRYANLSNAVPTATIYSIVAHEISDLIAYPVNAAPYCYVRHFSGGFGTVFSNPSVAISAKPESMAFTPY
jgi:hypothetical protein